MRKIELLGQMLCISVEKLLVFGQKQKTFPEKIWQRGLLLLTSTA